MRLLYLQSPELRGRDVLVAQQRLRKLGMKPGPLDGVYGPATAAAVRHLQRRAGILVDGIVGADTEAALEGPAAPASTPAHAGRPAPGLLALEWAEARLDVHDEGGPFTHRNAITAEFRLPGWWCMEFVSLAFKHGAGIILGETTPPPWAFWDGRGFAYVPAFEAWAKTAGYWHGKTQPERGAVCCFDWNGDGEPDHVGICRDDLGGGVFNCIEGDTWDDPEGPARVMLRRRYVSELAGIAYVTRRQP